MPSIFQDLAKRGRSAGITDAAARASREWFRDAAQGIARGRLSPNKMMQNADPFTKIEGIGAASLGKMYMFMYDPKTKDRLPYYDRFPMIFPIEMYSDGFLGINLHYLHPIQRAQLMDSLYTLLNNTAFNKTTKLNISYNILKETTRMAAFKPCIKRYLSSHVRSPFLHISPARWDMAIMLPLDRFVKASRDRVWADSMNKI